jgi:hypothetical protein
MHFSRNIRTIWDVSSDVQYAIWNILMHVLWIGTVPYVRCLTRSGGTLIRISVVTWSISLYLSTFPGDCYGIWHGDSCPVLSFNSMLPSKQYTLLIQRCSVNKHMVKLAVFYVLYTRSKSSILKVGNSWRCCSEFSEISSRIYTPRWNEKWRYQTGVTD